MCTNYSIEVTCEYKTSPRCKGTYYLSKSNAKLIRNKNNGKIICRYCSFHLKYTGNNNPNNKYDLDQDFFKSIDTLDKAYLLGWIASDGHIGKFGFVIVIHGKDRECLERLRNIINEKIPIKTIWDRKYNHDNVMLKVNSQSISNDLCKHLGIKPGKKSFCVNFPTLQNEDLTYEFIKGYFEGDGTINNYNKAKNLRCGITSISKSFISTLHNLEQGSFIQSGRWVNWAGKKALIFLDKIYKNSTNKLNRKYILYMEWKQKIVFDKHIGEKHYLAKLNEQKIIDIIYSYKNGISQNLLSKKYNVSRRTIQDVLQGKTWKKITQKLL